MISEDDVYQGDDFWWGIPFTPDFYKCKKCGMIFWRASWMFARCIWCQSPEIEEYGSFFMRPRPRKFLHGRSRIT